MARRLVRAALIGAVSSVVLSAGFVMTAPSAHADGGEERENAEAGVRGAKEVLEKAAKAEQQAKQLLESGRPEARVEAARMMQRAWRIREELWSKAQGDQPGRGGDAGEIERRIAELKRVSTDAEKMGHALREAGKPDEAEKKMRESGRLWKEAEALEARVKAARVAPDREFVDKLGEIERRVVELRRKSASAEREAHELRDAGKADAAEAKIGEATRLWREASELAARMKREQPVSDEKEAAGRKEAEAKAQKARASAEMARANADVAAQAAEESQQRARFARMEAERKAHEAKAADLWAAGRERAAAAEMAEADRIGEAMKAVKRRSDGAPRKTDAKREERKKERREVMITRDGKPEKAVIVVEPSGEKHVVVVDPDSEKKPLVVQGLTGERHVVVLEPGAHARFADKAGPDGDAAVTKRAIERAVEHLRAAKEKAETGSPSRDEARKALDAVIEKLTANAGAERTRVEAALAQARKRDEAGERPGPSKAADEGVDSLRGDVRRMQAELKALRGMIESILRSIKDSKRDEK